MYGPLPALPFPVPLPVPPVPLPVPASPMGTKMGVPATPVEAPVLVELPEAAAPTCEESGSPPQPGTAESNTGAAKQLTSRTEVSLRAGCFGCFEGIGSSMGSQGLQNGFHSSEQCRATRKSIGIIPRATS